MSVSQSDLVIVTREVETTPGVVVGGARTRVYGAAPTWDPIGEVNTSGITTGDAGIKSVRAGLRAADFSLPSELIFGLNRAELEDFFRDTYPVSELTAHDANTSGASLASATYDATTNGTGVNVTNAATVTFNVTLGTWTDGTHVISFEDSPDGSSWTACGAGDLQEVTDAGNIFGGTSITITDNSDESATAAIRYIGGQPHVRAITTVTGSPATGAVYSVSVAETFTGATLTFAQNGTHEDGSTGPTITGAADLFDDFIGYEGAMLRIAGSAVAAPNRWPRRIKAIKADGTKLDLMPEYTTGDASAFGEPLTAEGPVFATLCSIGKCLKNRGIANIRSVNFEFQFTDISGGSFQMVRGCKSSTMRLSFDGKGNVMLEFGYVGMDYDALTTATQGNGTVTANSFIDNDTMTAAEDLSYFVVGGTTILSAVNLTSFSVDGTGNAAGVDNVSGTRARTCVTVGDIDFTGSFTLYHEHDLMAVVQTLARNGNRVPIDLNFIDPAGNQIWVGWPKALFPAAGPKPGAKGSNVDSTLNFVTQLGANNARTCIWQEWEA